MDRMVLVQLRVWLVLGFLLILLTQTVLVPRVGAELAESFPEFAYLLIPYVSVVLCGLACVQAAAAAAWILIGLIARGGIATPRARACGTVMAAGQGTATVLAALLAGHLFWVVGQGNPASLFAFGLAVTAGAVTTVMAVNLRGRLGPQTDAGKPAPGRVRGIRL